MYDMKAREVVRRLVEIKLFQRATGEDGKPYYGPGEAGHAKVEVSGHEGGIYRFLVQGIPHADAGMEEQRQLTALLSDAFALTPNVNTRLKSSRP